MKILEISIQAFGTLENFKLDLREGGHAFYALNESGKSTCLTFLRCAFYGMPRQQKNLTKNLRLRFLPFNHERSQGSVLFENDGRTYRLMRIFGDKPSGDVTQLLDERLGEQIPLENPDAPGEEILGLEEGSFVNTVFVGQMKVPYSGDEDKNDLLLKRLMALGSSGDEEVSITTVRDALKDAERQLTSATRKNSILPGLEEEARTLKVRLSEARRERDALAQGMEELERKELELQGLGTELMEARAWARLHQLARDEAGLRQQEAVEAGRAQEEAQLRKALVRLEARPGFRDGQALREALDVAEALRREQDGQLARWEAQGRNTETFSDADAARLRQQEELRQKVQQRFADNEALQQALDAQRSQRQELERERNVLQDAIQREVEERRGVLDGLKAQLQEAKDAERSTHDRVTALELQMRDEGFEAGQKRSKVNRNYAKPYAERLRQDSNYLRLLREEVRLLTKLEGEESESVREKRRAIASYTTERLTELSDLPEPALVDEAQAAKLREYRTVLGIEAAEEEPSGEAPDFVEAEGEAPDTSNDDPSLKAPDAEDFPGESFIHLDVQNIPELELSQISPQGQKLHEDFRAREQALADARAEIEPAQEKLRGAEKDYYYSQAASEIAQSQILEVQSPSQLELVGYPALAIAASILTVLSAAWMLRFDYLYLLLVGFFIALAAYGIYNVLGLIERRRLVEDAQAKRLEASRYRKELEDAEAALEKAQEELQALEASLETLDDELTAARSAWEEREIEERRIHGQLRALRQRMTIARVSMDQLDRELPELARNYAASEAEYQEEQKKQEAKRREAQAAQDSAKALVEQRDTAVQKFWAEQSEINKSEEARGKRNRVDELQAAIEALGNAEEEQLAAQRREREALERELREAGYQSAQALDAAYEALSRKKQKVEAEARNLAAAREQLEENFTQLRAPWEGLLSQMKTLELLADEGPETEVLRALQPLAQGAAGAEWIARLRALSDELDARHKVLEQALRNYERLKETLSDLRARKATLETLAQWEQERTRLERELSRALTELSEVTQVQAEMLPQPEEEGAVDEAAWDQLRECLAVREGASRTSLPELEQRERQLLQEVSSLKSSLEKDGENVQSPEALARDLRATEEEIRYRKLQLAAIQMAYKGMDEGDQEMREHFSPQLQSYASEYLTQLTRGRYNRLMVKHGKNEMMLSVLDEELGRVVEGEYLSGGTYDQIYLALRLGMIKLLDPEAQLPLFLDDLLLQFDGERTRAALGVLDGLVREGRQILYFTCSEALTPLIEEVCPDWEVRPLLEAPAREG